MASKPHVMCNSVFGITADLRFVICRLQLEGIKHQANKLRSQSSAGSTALARWASNHVATLQSDCCNWLYLTSSSCCRAEASQSYQYEFCSDIQQYIKATLPFPELG